MILHTYPDGSVGHQYEDGDRVIIERRTSGINWKGREGVVTIPKGSYREDWCIRRVEVRVAEDWGPAMVASYNLKPAAGCPVRHRDGTPAHALSGLGPRPRALLLEDVQPVALSSPAP